MYEVMSYLFLRFPARGETSVLAKLCSWAGMGRGGDLRYLFYDKSTDAKMGYMGEMPIRSPIWKFFPEICVEGIVSLFSITPMILRR
jgi:hypothetical protein